MKPLRFLVTAGPTREYIDPVRFISNASSGRMGFAVAAAVRAAGHKVTLIHGPVERPPPPGVRAIPVVSAAEMLASCTTAWPECDVLIMTAAVADYSPAVASRRKLAKSARELTLRLRPTADILAALARTRRPDQTVIGFALQDVDARRRAADKLKRKRLDAIVLNRPANIAADRAVVEVLTRDGQWRSWPPGGKTAIARRLVNLALKLHAAAH